jgi:hypothetical protein
MKTKNYFWTRGAGLEAGLDSSLQKKSQKTQTRPSPGKAGFDAPLINIQFQSF